MKRFTVEMTVPERWPTIVFFALVAFVVMRYPIDWVTVVLGIGVGMSIAHWLAYARRQDAPSEDARCQRPGS